MTLPVEPCPALMGKSLFQRVVTVKRTGQGLGPEGVIKSG